MQEMEEALLDSADRTMNSEVRWDSGWGAEEGVCILHAGYVEENAMCG